ncbi:ROK family protein [Cohnella silvisoli]|uniref:ROK family protein n=1 Tax=Cohnella silvisoli TaxID=2873699 RepID=A0ABV1KUD3_9BACL|nr:ROK family protein [Cohnella silvisoli]MCD9023228.1 ROK family protein [Cohnella silvisoli]
MAEHYGIGSVWKGLYGLEEVKKGRMRWEEWLPDGLHPTERGSLSYGRRSPALFVNIGGAVMSTGRNELAIGADIGGTNLKLGLVTREGTILGSLSLPLARNSEGGADLAFIAEEISYFIQQQNLNAELAGVGVASPGVIDKERGVVIHAVNLGWSNVRMVEYLQRQLQLPVRLESDAVAGAIGEKKYGAAMEMDSFLYICIGTGVGASLFLDGHFYEGDSGAAIDMGHMCVIHNGFPCKCGNYGCLEKYVSGSAITARAQLDARMIFQAAESGDEFACKVFEEAGQLLGIALVNALHLFGVGNIVIGGGVSQADAYLLEPARQMVRDRFSRHTLPHIRIERAAYPITSGVVGAAASFFEDET